MRNEASGLRDSSGARARPARRQAPSLFLTVALAVGGTPGGVVAAQDPTTTDDLRYGASPGDVRNGMSTIGDHCKVFLERSGVTLPSPLGVVRAYGGSAAILPGGILVDSYLIHCDLPDSVPFATFYGTVTFGNTVLGMILETGQLVTSDSWFMEPTTLYDAYPDRGLETNDDAVILGGVTVEATMQVDTGMDHIRIIVGSAARRDDAGSGIDAGPEPIDSGSPELDSSTAVDGSSSSSDASGPSGGSLVFAGGGGCSTAPARTAPVAPIAFVFVCLGRRAARRAF